jgi:hypothetical protein
VKLTTPISLVQRLNISGTVPPLQHTPENGNKILIKVEEIIVSK